MNKYLLFSIIGMVLLNSCSYKKKLTAKRISLSPLYSSGMVIQTSPDTRINGNAEPGSTLAVKISDYMRLATADKNGKWQVQFPQIILSKPFSLFIEGADTSIEIKNVLAGNIYVVAGDAFLDAYSSWHQDSCSEPDGFSRQNIKVFRPVLSTINFPANEFLEGEWIPINQLLRDARSCKVIQLIEKLSEDKSTAIGIIDLTWPGSSLEAWMPGLTNKDSSAENLVTAKLRQLPEYNDSIFSDIKYMTDTCRNGIKKGAKKLWFDDEFWKQITLPVNISKRFDYQKKRIVYLRKKIYVPSQYLTSDFVINLGKIHGRGEYYFNEAEIKGQELENGSTQLIIPDSIMNIWANLLAVRLVCTDSLAGFYGTNFTCSNLDSTFQRDIHEDWKYNQTLEVDFPQHIEFEKYPSSMFNGMLSPVLNHEYYSFVWYGGINNLGTDYNLKTDICNLIEIAGREKNTIAFDVFEDEDSLVYGQNLRQLEKTLEEAGDSCNTKVTIANN